MCKDQIGLGTALQSLPEGFWKKKIISSQKGDEIKRFDGRYQIYSSRQGFPVV